LRFAIKASWFKEYLSLSLYNPCRAFVQSKEKDGIVNLAIELMSEKREREAAQHFFKQAQAVVGQVPERVTTDGHASYPRAVREVLGNAVQHRTNKYLNNLLEQDHRGVKQRDYPMHGFGHARVSGSFLSCCRMNCATLFAQVALWEKHCLVIVPV
jgi:transposase-like protein